MKKILPLFIIISICISQLFADGYFGIGFGSGKGKQETEITDNKTNYTVKERTLKFGIILPNLNRIGLSLHSTQASSLGDETFIHNTFEPKTSEYFGVSLDFLATLGENENFLPFIDLSIGHSINRSTEYTSPTGDLNETIGESFALGIGVMTSFDNIEFEFALRGKRTRWNFNPLFIDTTYYAYFGVNALF